MPEPWRVVPRSNVDAFSRSAIWLVVAVAAGVRVLALGSLGFNSDEAVYAGQAAAMAGYSTSQNR